MINNFNDYQWADSQIKSIHINQDNVIISVYQDSIGKHCCIICREVVGITDVCMWDDSDILNAGIQPALDTTSTFLNNVYNAYTNEYVCSSYKSLKNNLLDLSIELTNQITMHIYCYMVELKF